MGILGNEAVDVCPKHATEGVPPDGHENWMSGGRMIQWVWQRKRGYVEVEGEERGAFISRAMGCKREQLRIIAGGEAGRVLGDGGWTG